MDDPHSRKWWFSGAEEPRRPGAATSGEDQPSPRAGPPAPGPPGQDALSPGDGVSLPSISLPKGGGAIRGIDEKLTVDQPTGSARISVPVYTSPARQAFGPQLALSYDSGAGNGPYGLGWSISVGSISRKTSMGLPRYDDAEDSDVFVLAGVEDLVPLLEQSEDGQWMPETLTGTTDAGTFTVRRYRPRVEAAFSRIERWQNQATGNVHWRTVSRDNVTSLYGQSGSSQIADPMRPGHVFSWLLDFTYDDRGNAISYQYQAENTVGVTPAAHELGRVVTANRYLKRILYGNQTPYRGEAQSPTDWCLQVVMDYGDIDQDNPTPTPPADPPDWKCRPDPFSTYRPGFEVRTFRRCQRILMFHRFVEDLGRDWVVVRSTELDYVDQSAQEPRDPALPQYSLLASVIAKGWIPSLGQTAELPPVQFTYSPLTVDDTLQMAGLDDQPGDLDGTRRRWVDLAGEGLQGILTEDDGAWYYKHNLSAWNPQGEGSAARFGRVELLAAKPSLTRNDGNLELTELNGDGRLCAVNFAEPGAGWFELDEDGSWEPLRLFSSKCHIDWRDPNLRFVDVDGDGLADVLITEDEVLTWYGYIADGGFAAPEWVRKPFDEDRGPALVFADGTGSVLLADMSGDGLTDLVRVRAGEVCYWPNLGYGRFGPKITMDDAPQFDYPDRFDPRRIRFADIDGSGTADLAYVGSDTTTIWFNQSGNTWTAGTELSAFPPVDDIARASVFDLLGTGTAAAVWTSPLPGDASEPLRYIDLTAGTKPYLLQSVTNNLGATATLSYAPSTRFYLQDRAAGDPWLTRLPFPVHVVERVEVDEGVSGTSLVSTYSYHHGFYDPTEREFRGFARVDHLDAETLPTQAGTGQFTDTAVDDLTLAPVWTRTWYHTGAFFGGEEIARRLALEYYQGDPEAPELAGTALPAGASAEEMREACRALRGRVLRQEIYAQDELPASVNPYTTTAYRYEVDQLQPPAGPAYGAYYAWELEHVSCHYERDPTDPRIAHDLTLTIDDFGNVTSHASVGYPRRGGTVSQQSSTLILYTESDVTNVPDLPDSYRVGVPIETRTYELTGLPPLPANGIFDHDQLAHAAGSAAAIPYEQTPSGGIQRRLLKRKRTIYLKNNLSASLGVGQVESLALVYCIYQLAYTPGLLSTSFVGSGKLTPSELTTALADGGFVDLDGDGNQWAPSSQPTYSASDFYLVQGATDPWGNVSTVTYDAYDLLVVHTFDAAQNLTTARHNYRVLQPWLVTDANLNRSGVRIDALGMVTATALMGKLQPDGTDEGDHLDTSTAEASPSDDPTTSLDYDLSAYQTWNGTGVPTPAWVHTRARVTHKDPDTEWLETYAYSDGLGRVALTKIQAEPGSAPERGANGNLVYDDSHNLVFAQSDSRWVGTGRVVYDNKGNPVKAYEPFFDSSSAYDDETELVDWGVTAITRFDPLSRAIRVDNPNGTFRTVTFDPWSSVTSDENDTVLGSAWYQLRTTGTLAGISADADAATKAAAHANTPTTSDFDPLGRTFQTVLDNGPAGTYTTVLKLDIEGNVLATTDALGRAVLSTDYCPAGTALHHISIDSGQRWMLYDARAEHLYGWDAGQYQIRCAYDVLRRPAEIYVTTYAEGTGERLAEQITYGDNLANANLLSNAQTLNLRASAYQQYDQAGVATTNQRDFKNNFLSATRKLLERYPEDVDWSQPQAFDPADEFTTTSTYDALNRTVTVTTPDGSVTTNTYNQRSLISAVSVAVAASGAAPSAATTVVTSVLYDAKGQRLTLVYGNNATANYSYDPETLRLIGLLTTRPAGADDVQDLTYTYDPVGNITQITDDAQPTLFFSSQLVAPTCDYTYDPIYRLIRATGREHVGQTTVPPGWDDAATTGLPLPTDSQAIRNYFETYAYDPVGNFSKVVHTVAQTPPGGGWAQTYAYDTALGSPVPINNHLVSTTVGPTTSSYRYDPHGNINSMRPLTQMGWDWKDQLANTARQYTTDTGPQPETTYYRYDAGGQRIRKLNVNSAEAIVYERIYLGAYEIYREYSGGKVASTLQTLHISDGVRRVCLVETTTSYPDGENPRPSSTVWRYQLDNHLGSAVVELDSTAKIISYEEYYPFGATSLQALSSEVSQKRYRYTGKERDEESGFYYHGARYYAPWLGRWLSCDPADSAATVKATVYAYARSNPFKYNDPTGADDTPAAPPRTLPVFTDSAKTRPYGSVSPQEVNFQLAWNRAHGLQQRAAIEADAREKAVQRALPPAPAPGSLAELRWTLGEETGLHSFARAWTGATHLAQPLSMDDRIGEAILGSAKLALTFPEIPAEAGGVAFGALDRFTGKVVLSSSERAMQSAITALNKEPVQVLRFEKWTDRVPGRDPSKAPLIRSTVPGGPGDAGSFVAVDARLQGSNWKTVTARMDLNLPAKLDYTKGGVLVRLETTWGNLRLPDLATTGDYVGLPSGFPDYRGGIPVQRGLTGALRDPVAEFQLNAPVPIPEQPDMMFLRGPKTPF